MEPQSYTRMMGDVVLNDGFTFKEAEREIFENMDEAATVEDWDWFEDLTNDLNKLEQNRELMYET